MLHLSRVQPRVGYTARRSSDRRNLPRRLPPVGGRSFPVFVRLSFVGRLFAVIAVRQTARQELDAYQEHAFGTISLASPGVVVASGAHPTSLRDMSALCAMRSSGRNRRRSGVTSAPGLGMPISSVRRARHHYRGNRMLENQLLLVVRIQDHRILVEGANAARQLYSAQKIDSNN